jgi:hypothetical protein
MLLGVFLPLFNFLIIVCFSRLVGKIGVIYLTGFTFVGTVLFNIYNFYSVIFGNTVYFFKLASWMQVGLVAVD